MKVLVSASALALAAAVASFDSPSSSVPAPSVAPVASRATFEIDTVHSAVLFRTKHFDVSQFWGRFNEFSGTVDYDAAKPEACAIQIEILAESIDSNSEGRDKHLRSPDFLSAKEFPVIVFESTSVKKKGDGLEVTGDLTLHGVTKEVVATVDVIGEAETPQGYKAGFEARFTVDMRDFDISFVKQRGGLGPDVDLIVSLECARK